MIAPPLTTERKPDEPIPDPLGLVKLLSPEPAPPRIPVQFFPAPGPSVPKRPAPERHPLPSDANRVAHGGDPALPKSPVPKSVAQAGIQDLSQGRNGGDGGTEAARQAAAAEERTERQVPAAPKPLVGIPGSALAGITAEQAARLAKSGGGDGGAGFARDGGFADSGPLSFDTTDYDWGGYASEMIRRIKRNWDVPGLARDGIRGRVTIRFTILKDGRVTDEQILASSGIPPFDNAAFQSIARSSPFRPLPADLGKDHEGVTVTFFYNIRPEDTLVPPRG